MNQDLKYAVRVRDFIIKLAQADKELDSVKFIVEQFNQLEQNPYFTNVFEELNPDNFFSQTKHLDEQ